ncbi:unnamed protein product [Camellia sinensis]
MGERTGLAWVCFDFDDHRVYEEAILGPSMLSPQQAEAAAVLHALRWAVHSGINHLLLQTDCLVLLLLLHHNAQESDWCLQSILADILSLCKSFDHVVLQKVDRDVVYAAHQLATDILEQASPTHSKHGISHTVGVVAAVTLEVGHPNLRSRRCKS